MKELGRKGQLFVGTLVSVLIVYGMEIYFRDSPTSAFPDLLNFIKWALGITVSGNGVEWTAKALGGGLKAKKK